MDDWTQWAPLMLAGLLMVPAAICDLRHRRIPNLLTLAGFIAGLTLHGWLSGWGGAVLALLSGVALLTSMFGLFALGWLGAGDVKLLATAGAIGGNLLTALNIVLATAVVGGLLGLFMLVRRCTNDPRQATSVPYAVAISIGTLLAILYQRI